MGLLVNFMAQSERLGLPVSPETCESQEKGRLLLRLADLPTRDQFLKMYSRRVLEAPLHASLLLTDFAGGALKLAQHMMSNGRFLKDLPHGHGEAVVSGTGLLAPEASLWPINQSLTKTGYRVLPVDLPGILNYEHFKRRAQLIIQKASEGFTLTGQPVKGVFLSKETLSMSLAAALYPKEVADLFDHVVYLGNPLGSEINLVAVGGYLGTQVINRWLNRSDDFQFLEELKQELGEDAEIYLPAGIAFTEIDSRSSGITLFAQNGQDGTIWVDCTHTALAFDNRVISIIAHVFAGYEPAKVAA